MDAHDRRLLRALAGALLPAIARIDRLASEHLEAALAPAGITLAQLRLVGALLGEDDGMSQRELARRVRVEAPTLSVAIQKLEAAGVVERRPDPADGRAWRVRLARRGDHTAAAMAAITDLERRATAGIDAAELGVARRVLARILTNLESP